jgi:Na+/H+-dicarboxylate symporter
MCVLPVLAVIVGLVLVNIVQPGNSIKEETRIDLVQEYEQGVLEKQQQAQRTIRKWPLYSL